MYVCSPTYIRSVYVAGGHDTYMAYTRLFPRVRHAQKMQKNTQNLQKRQKQGFSSTTLVYVNVFQRTAARCTQPAYTYMRTRILEPVRKYNALSGTTTPGHSRPRIWQQVLFPHYPFGPLARLGGQRGDRQRANTHVERERDREHTRLLRTQVRMVSALTKETKCPTKTFKCHPERTIKTC